MRSRWIFLTFALATAAICGRLGLWQLSRLSERRHDNAIARGALAEPPITLPGGASPLPGRRIAATGSFDHDHELVLRGRAHDGAPGIEIATPLRLRGSDSALIVIRGFVPSDDAMSVDLSALREPGEQNVHGIAFAVSEEADSGAPVTHGGTTSWRRLDLGALRSRVPYPVHAVALWQQKETGMSGMPIRLGAPELSDGPHLNYAIQWFAFAAIFLVGGIVFTFRRRVAADTHTAGSS